MSEVQEDSSGQQRKEKHVDRWAYTNGEWFDFMSFTDDRRPAD